MDRHPDFIEDSYSADAQKIITGNSIFYVGLLSLILGIAAGTIRRLF